MLVVKKEQHRFEEEAIIENATQLTEMCAGPGPQV